MEEIKLVSDEYLPLRDVVFRTLREAILKGKIKPGERLMEIQLAKKLGVSRTPVREAIRMLELEGLVTMVPRKGAAVAAISEKTLRDVLEVRRALEELSVMLACERMTWEQFEELRAANTRFARAAEGEDITLIAKTDEDFHDIIYQSTGNDKLILLLNELREQMYRYRVEHIKMKERRSILIKEHQEIIDALRERNADIAVAVMRKHINNQEIQVTKKLKEKE